MHCSRAFVVSLWNNPRPCKQTLLRAVSCLHRVPSHRKERLADEGLACQCRLIADRHAACVGQAHTLLKRKSHWRARPSP